MPKLTRHFTEEELACPCCGLCNIHPKFLYELERYRQMVNEPITVLSGMRCLDHNETLKNAAPHSWHMFGKAADLKWTRNKFMMLRIALATFDGVGVGKDLLHVDLGGKQKLWIY